VIQGIPESFLTAKVRVWRAIAERITDIIIVDSIANPRYLG
jgi:hypothetical protein